MPNTITIKKSSLTGVVPTTLQDGELAINQADKLLFYKDNLGVIRSFSLVAPTGTVTRQVITLANAFSSTVVARANVTGMSFAVTTGKKYSIYIVGDYQTAVTTTGGSIGFVLTSGTGTIRGSVTMSVSQGATNTNQTTTIRAINATNTTAGSFITSTGVSVINSPHYFSADLIFDCLTSGVFQLQYASEVAASASQINSGSVMIIETLN
jgi:hypothetical protein